MDTIKAWLAGARIGHLHTCQRKVQYGHLETALRAVAHMEAKGKTDLEAYKCPVCGKFHIGHKRSVVT